MMRRSFPSAAMSACSSAMCSLPIRPRRVKTTSPFASLSILSIPFGHNEKQMKRQDKLLKLKGLLGMEDYEFRKITKFVRASYLIFEGSVPLKRFLLIPSVLIFDSRVVPGMPSLAAAPDGPDTLPPHSRRAASIMVFS